MKTDIVTTLILRMGMMEADILMENGMMREVCF